MGDKLRVKGEALCFGRGITEFAELLLVVDMLVLHVIGLCGRREVLRNEESIHSSKRPKGAGLWEHAELLAKLVYPSEASGELPQGASCTNCLRLQTRSLTALIAA